MLASSIARKLQEIRVMSARRFHFTHAPRQHKFRFLERRAYLIFAFTTALAQSPRHHYYFRFIRKIFASLRDVGLYRDIRHHHGPSATY